MRRLPRVLLAAAALAGAGPAWAETDLMGGGTFLVGAPHGAFDVAAGTGFGLEGYALVTPPRAPYGLRVEGSFLVYGHERTVVPFPGTGGRVGADLVTDNWIGTLSVGPQVMARSGTVRPYVRVLAGLSYFATTSELQSADGFRTLARSTNYDDVAFGWSAGCGINVPVSRSLAIDLGVAYASNGRVSYLTEGDIQDDGHGGAILNPRRSTASLMQFTFGLSGGW